MTEIARCAGGPWRNEHRSIHHRMARGARLIDAGGGDLAQWLARRRDVLGAFLGEELAAGNRLCVTGSGWSQADLFGPDATLLETEADEGIAAIPDSAFADDVTKRHRYVMVAGGTKIARLMQWLEADGRSLSLATAGSHKGQSVAGMLGTGSHGSMLERSGFECHVRGLVLSTGPGEAKWLARDKLLRDDFVERFATVADPALFESALIHLGGMGVVSALLLEVEDAFGLGRIKRKRVLPPGWAALCAGSDFAGATGGDRDPTYYEITLDPFRGSDHEALETIWYANDAHGSDEAPDPGERHLFDLMVEGVTQDLELKLAQWLPEGALADEVPIGIDVPWVTWLQFDEADEPDAAYPLSKLVVDWQPRTIFGLRVDVYNAAFAVPLERLPQALAIAFEMGDDAWFWERDYVFTVRFARQCPAAMGFLRFERNAVINIDGLAKNFLLGSVADNAALDLAKRFETAGLPFSMHWGKDAPSCAEKIGRDFEIGAAAYREARRTLLGDRAALFASPMLAHWGLS